MLTSAIGFEMTQISHVYLSPVHLQTVSLTKQKRVSFSAPSPSEISTKIKVDVNDGIE